MVLVPGTSALDEGDAFDLLAVRRPQDPALCGTARCGESFKHHAGQDIRVLSESEIVDL